MAEPVTLEFLSRQCDRVLEEIASTRNLMRQSHDALLRCIVTGARIQLLLDECLAVMKAANEIE